MDPNETLCKLREALTDFDGDAAWFIDNASSILDKLEAIEALDEWLTNGGYLPADWDRPDIDRPPF